jgi:hypothetical protein
MEKFAGKEYTTTHKVILWIYGIQPADEPDIQYSDTVFSNMATYIKTSKFAFKQKESNITFLSTRFL